MNIVQLNTALGNIKGIKDGDALLFNGIPYAVTKRFEAPVIINYLKDYDAASIPSDCPQEKYFYPNNGKDSFYDKEFRGNPECSYDENRMCLSIITKMSDKKMPVLIFIHGGGFETGSLHELPYGMSKEYLQRDILLVNIAYRLNIFGFYKGRNYGLEDMVSAIEWVKQYIGEFNGDKDRISLMGQSAGAMSIFDLLLSERLKGTIRNVIMCSGAGSPPFFARPYTKQESDFYWDGMLESAGIKDDEELKKLTDRELFDIGYHYKKNHFNFHIHQPSIDKTLIPAYSKEIMKKAKELKIPVLAGVTSQDYLGPVLYRMTLNFLLEHNKNGVQECYGYFFDRTPPGKSYKAFHGSDLFYVMGQMDKNWRKYEKEDIELKEYMMDAFAQFIKTDHPGHGFKPINRDNKDFKVFDGKRNGSISPFSATLKTLYYFLFDKGPM